MRSLDSYIPATATARYLEGKRRILIVGDAGGREWRYLSQLGKEIHVVDIAPQENIPNLCVQSIERQTPFPEEYFDGVVMNEVLEHLFHDVSALEEVHRILKDDGVLVITVPYFSNQQDQPECHVRVHSKKTMVRLLENCGFRLEEHFYRGFCSRLPQKGIFFTALIYGSQKLVELVTHKTPDASVAVVNGFFAKLEQFLGTYPVGIGFQSRFTSFGGIMKAAKGPKKDFHGVQKAHFSNSILS